MLTAVTLSAHNLTEYFLVGIKMKQENSNNLKTPRCLEAPGVLLQLLV